MRWGSLAGLLAVVVALPGCSTPVTGPATDRGPERIVVMAPAAAEMLDALGEIDRIVGIGDFVDRPPSIVDRPRVGGYDAPNVERVLELGAELYLSTTSDAARSSHRRLESLGVAVLPLDTSTYEGVFRSLEELGRRIGREARAGEVRGAMRERLDRIEQQTARLSRPGVLFVVGRDPLYVAGPGSHIDEMIRLAGGSNVAHDAHATYERFSIEAVLERMPDVIIDTSDNRPGALRGRQPGAWGRWEFLPAVQQDRVYWVEPSKLVIPGMRLPEMTALMARLVHPEVFGEVSREELSP